MKMVNLLWRWDSNMPFSYMYMYYIMRRDKCGTTVCAYIHMQAIFPIDVLL